MKNQVRQHRTRCINDKCWEYRRLSGLRVEHRAVVVNKAGADELMSGLSGSQTELNDPLLGWRRHRKTLKTTPSHLTSACACVCVSPCDCVCTGSSLSDGDMHTTWPLGSTSPGVSLRSSNTHDTPPDSAGTFCTRIVNCKHQR